MDQKLTRMLTQEELNEMVESHKYWLQPNTVGTRLVLKGVTIDGLKINATDLRFASLSHVSANNTDWHGINLAHVSVEDSDFDNSDFGQANLKYASFINNNMMDSNFEYAHIEKTSFQNSYLNNGKFSRTLILKSNFSQSILEGAYFSEAMIYNSDFSRIEASKADFNNAKVDHCLFIEAYLSNSNFQCVNGVNDFSASTLRRVQFDYANFASAAGLYTRFINTDLTESTFNYTLLSGANFADAKLENVLFVHSNLSDAIFNLKEPLANVANCYDNIMLNIRNRKDATYLGSYLQIENCPIYDINNDTVLPMIHSWDKPIKLDEFKEAYINYLKDTRPCGIEEDCVLEKCAQCLYDIFKSAKELKKTFDRKANTAKLASKPKKPNDAAKKA